VRRWLRDNWRSVAWTICFGLVVVSIALNRDAIVQIQDERRDRIAQQTEINCSLSTLVQASLEAGTFGEGIDEEDLTPFQARMIAAIGRIQLLMEKEANSSQQLTIFRRELRQLREHVDCKVEDARDRRDAREAVRNRREASRP
jgi:hypothetical protein